MSTSGFCPEKYDHLDIKNAVTHFGKYNSFKTSIKLKNEIFESAMKNYDWIPFARDSAGHLSSLYSSPILTPPHADQSYRARDEVIFDNAQV